MKTVHSKIKTYDIVIVGGGPAGLAAAISAKLYSKKNNQKISIAIIESNNHIGKSILKTGNGRCNFSNLNIQNEFGQKYYNSEFCNSIFNNCQKMVCFYNIFDTDENGLKNLAPYQMFDYLGLACHVDNEGRMYPYTNKASSVVDVLRYAIEDLSIKVYTNAKVQKIDDDKIINLFVSKDSNQIIVKSRKIINCVGLNENNKLFGRYKFSPIKNILGPININCNFIKNLDGIKCYAKVLLIDKNENILCEEYGEVLFRKYGVSGICIFNVSRFVEDNSNQCILLDMFPNTKYTDLLNIVNSRYEKIVKYNSDCVKADRLLSGLLLPQLAIYVSKKVDMNFNDIKKNEISNLCKSLKGLKLSVKSIGDEKICQITRGGIDVKALDEKSLSLKDNKNIYFAGELVDVDGPCGGYNLHWAWTSGIMTGIASCKNL